MSEHTTGPAIAELVKTLLQECEKHNASAGYLTPLTVLNTARRFLAAVTDEIPGQSPERTPARVAPEGAGEHIRNALQVLYGYLDESRRWGAVVIPQADMAGMAIRLNRALEQVGSGK